MLKLGAFRPERWLIVLMIVSLIMAAVHSSAVRAAAIAVNTIDDEVNSDGDCSLREAIIAANTDATVDGCAAGAGDDTISVPPGTYVLTLAGAGEDATQAGDLDITSNIIINGAGQSATIIDGNAGDRVFDLLDANVQLSGVTLQNGSGTVGGGINIKFDSTLILSASRITSNTASGSGGGIFASGALTMTTSRIDGNSTVGGGGGVSVAGGPVIISASEISGNSADGSGGGIFSSGTLTMINSTLSGNRANSGGGGLFVIESPNNRLYNVTISANTADADGNGQGEGGGVRVGIITAANTLIGGNLGGNQKPDCAGALNSEGYNLITNINGCTIGGDTTGNLLGVDALLGPLQNNGGSTLTHALLDASPAIDAANPGGCRDGDGNLLPSDQRGADRSVGGRCDIGAYEAGAATEPTTTPPTPSIPPTTPTVPTEPPGAERVYLPLIQS